MNKKLFFVAIFFILFFIFVIFEPIKIIKKGAFGSYSNSSLLSESFVSKYKKLSLAYSLYYNYSITKNDKVLEEAKKLYNVSSLNNLTLEFDKLLEEENIKEKNIVITNENFSFLSIFLFTFVAYLLFFIFEQKILVLPIINFCIVFPFLVVFGIDEFIALALISSFLFGFFEQGKKLELIEISMLFAFSILFYLLGLKAFEYFAIFGIASIPKLFVKI
jgi:hypothetical protein